MEPSRFIYYRVAPSALERVAPAVRAMQARLMLETGVAGRLLRRAEDAMTWMEIYESATPSASFESALQRLVGEFGLDALLAPGERRHMERFLPCV